MKTRLLCFYLMTFLFICISNAQVGIGNTNPQAQLDISASNTGSPTNLDGILIPRVSSLPAVGSMTSFQDGILVFYTGTANSGKGFYYWDEGATSWVKIAAGVTGDIDWYEEGTTDAPDNINDNIFTQGNVGIGENNPVNPIHIGTSTSFDLSYANTGQDGIFIDGGFNNSGLNSYRGSIGFGPASSIRKGQRKAAIAAIQTGGDIDHLGFGFFVHGNPVNQSPMVEAMRLTHQNFLGINNNNPSANLDIIGTFQFEDGNQALGYVLSSDANGNATWTDPAVTEVDGDVTNELQDLTLTGDELQISNGTSASMRAFINPKYPDGFENMEPITLSNINGSSNQYVVPTGKNLYITSIYSTNDNNFLLINNLGVYRGRENTANFQSLTSPIIAAAGDSIFCLGSSSVSFVVNGFLVDAFSEPISLPGGNYTVPTGKIFVILNFSIPTASGIITISGTTIYRGSGNYLPTQGPTPFFNPIFANEGDVVTANAAINGYLIDK